MKSISLSFGILLILFGNSYGYKILGIFPINAKSHYFVGSALMKGLANSGHDVTMISQFPLKAPLSNYRDIPLTSTEDKTKDVVQTLFDASQLGIAEAFQFYLDEGVTWTKALFEDHEIEKLMSNKSEEFDVVIVENIINEAMLGFGHHFQAPLISVSSYVAGFPTYEMVGTPSPPSYVPHVFLSFSDHMTLVERIVNLLMSLFERLYSNYFYLPRQKAIYDQVFPDPKPPFEEVTKNVSLVLLNSHSSLGYPRPYLPNMIDVGGMHINRKPKQLPADLQKYLDAAKEGVIYFSMGSVLKSKFLPREKVDHLINAFKSLKQKVLWKWEDDNLPGKSDNIYISKWFPQDDILAHPNVKLFITHGGLLSTTEAIYHGVPVIGIPIVGDQFLNMGKMVKAKMGLMVKYKELTSDTLKPAINEILNNNQYKISMQEISQRYRDQPMNPLDTAIYWVEYIARHKGAAHLRSGAQDLSFIAYHNLDAIAILGGGVFLIIYLFIAMLMKLLTCGSSPSKALEKKKKKQ